MTIRSAPVLVLALAMLAAPAQAAPADVAAAFGNTVVSTYPDGRKQRIWLRPDGVWEAFGRRQKWSSGRWFAKPGKVCFRQSKPFPAPFSYCADFPDRGGVGAVWTSKDMSGVPITVQLVPGIDRPV